jgi:hypothetical protein
MCVRICDNFIITFLQRKPIGNEIERSLAKILEANQSLQKVTLDIREQSTRNAIEKTIMRNKEAARKKRQEAKK